MEQGGFQTPSGVTVPAVTAVEMREVDRVAEDVIGLSLLQMMENAGRSLAAHVRMLRDDGSVVVVAGAGGNGGGGLACARHLVNRGIPVSIVLDRNASELDGVTATQYRILEADDVSVTEKNEPIASASVLVDALIGYGLQDAPHGRARELIEAMKRAPGTIISLDIPSGLDATTGEAPGQVVRPDRTLTLALPKTGLCNLSCDLYLGDISIPVAVFRHLDIPYTVPFVDDYWVRIVESEAHQ